MRPLPLSDSRTPYRTQGAGDEERVMGRPSSALKRKRLATRRFAELVASSVPGVYRVYLFGSVAKGTADEGSDVDVLVVLAGPEGGYHGELSQAALAAYEETGESVEYVTMGVERFLAGRETNPFVHEVEEYGELLYANGGALAERAKALLRLADEFARGAEEARKVGHLRIAVDAYYNATELVVKALLVADGRPLPRTHGGYIHAFAEAYARAGRAPEDLVADLHRGLELGSKARYDPDYSPSPSDCSALASLYEELRRLAAKALEL